MHKGKLLSLFAMVKISKLVFEISGQRQTRSLAVDRRHRISTFAELFLEMRVGEFATIDLAES